MDSTVLSTSYDVTAKAWRARYGVPYSICGCVPDPETESRLSRFASKITKIGSKREKNASETPAAPVNTRPDLVSTEDEDADSSHPSEHNIYFGDPNERMTALKKAARERHSEKCATSAKKAAARDPWRALQAQRNEKHRDAHKEAFTNPWWGSGAYYPYWGVSVAIPLGFYGS